MVEAAEKRALRPLLNSCLTDRLRPIVQYVATGLLASIMVPTLVMVVRASSDDPSERITCIRAGLRRTALLIRIRGISVDIAV